MNKFLLLSMLGSSPAFAVNLTPFIEASLGGAGAWAAAEKGNALGLPSKSKRLTGSFRGGLHGGGDVYITDPSQSVAFTVGAGIGGALATKYGATQSGGPGGEGLAGTVHFTMAVLGSAPGIAALSVDSSPSQGVFLTAPGSYNQGGFLVDGKNVAVMMQLDASGTVTDLGINALNPLNPPFPYSDGQHQVDVVPGGGAGGALKFHSKGYWDVSARLGMKWHRLHLVAKLGYAHHGLKAYSLSSSGSWAGLKTRGVPCLLTGLGATFDLTPSWAVGATAQVHLGKFKVKGYSSGTPFTLKERFSAVEGLMTLTYKMGALKI